ncbi:MAG: tyrosine-type recombinase/integrase [Acidimicrobiales bacterium]
MAVLATHRKKVDARAQAIGCDLSPEAYVWSQAGDSLTPWKPNRVTDAFRTHRKRVKLEHVNFHHLRHFSATTLAGAGVDVRTIAGRLGHANPAITLRTYAHFLEATDRQAAQVMGRLSLPDLSNPDGQTRLSGGRNFASQETLDRASRNSNAGTDPVHRNREASALDRSIER